MCLTVPAQVVRVDGNGAWIVDEFGERPLSLAAVESVAAGDWVLHHAGLVIERLDSVDAVAILELLAELKDQAVDQLSKLEAS